MQNHAQTPAQDASIGEAGAIAMERYDLSEPRALALLSRLARRHKVDVRVVAAAIIAAALARRRAARVHSER